MIDPEREEIVSLTEAAAYVHKKFGRPTPHQNTMARWCMQGLRGHRLESLKCGSSRVTSLQAIVRFFQRVTEPQSEPPNSAREQRAAQANQQLASQGW